MLDAVGGRRQGFHAANGCKGLQDGVRRWATGCWAGGRHRGHRKCEGNGLPEESENVGRGKGEGKRERNGCNIHKVRVFLC